MLTSDQQNNNHNHKTKKKKPKASLPDRVSALYYKHGLFLSSYPTCATSISIVVVLFCWFPLLNIPFPGTIPTKIILPYNGSPISTAAASISEINQYDNNTSEAKNIINNKFTSFALNSIKIHNLSLLEPPFPSWARLDPFVYIQQIVLRVSVQPWKDSLRLTDAFRGPLFEVYKLLEFVRNHEDENKTNLGHLCLHVETVKRSDKGNLFPQYNCLILSPANFWQQSTNAFKSDSNLLNTIFQNHNLQKTKVSTAEMLFGMPLRDTGIKRYPMRNRPRIIQYAITLVLKNTDQHYLESLKAKLQKFYPLHQQPTTDKPPQPTVMFVYYPGEFNLLDFLPLCGAFVIQFLYVYFSVRKIEVIRSRFILAVSSVITVLGSLVMSLGLCFFFGLTISMQSRSVFPYLVILVGLENVLVLTKSVVTTDNNLDVKIRMAQGLSLEGWSITKNLMTEITILTIGLATFVPVIQEFCIFAIVGLLSDYFLQMLFFSTVLAMDIKRVEYSVEVKQLPKILSHTFYQNKNLVTYKYASTTTTATTNAGIINRSRSHPKLSSLDVSKQAQQATDVIATTTHTQVEKKIPKRLRIVNLWARTRFFQRGFMIWMVLWISNIIYNSGLIEELFVIDKNSSFVASKFGEAERFNGEVVRNLEEHNVAMNDPQFEQAVKVSKLPEVLAEENLSNSTEQINRLRHPEFDTNFHLSNFHWASILKQYNISISGHYVTILPTIRLSHAVPPEVAENLRNPNEKAPQHFQWKALAVALDPIDFNDLESDEIVPPINPTGKVPLYPKTPMELLLTGILCAVSVFVLAYTMVVLYRCICSRNYAEWRASWNDTEVIEPKTERVLEAHPIQVNGHTHRIECLVTDGNMIASSCLQGQLKIWDATNGEQISQIDRRKYFKQQRTEYFLLLQQQQQQQHQLSKADSPSESSTQHNSLNSHGTGSPPPTALTNHNTNKSTNSSPSSSMSASPPKLLNGPSSASLKVSSIKNKINFNFSSQDLHDPKQNDFQLSYQKYFYQPVATPKLTNYFYANGHGEHGDSDEAEDYRGSTEYVYFNDIRLGTSTHNGRPPPPPQPSARHRRNHSYSNTLVSRKNISFELDYHQVTPTMTTGKGSRASLSSSPHSSQLRSQQQQQPSPIETISRKFYNLSPIWCLDFLDNLIVIGCADGRLEFWEGTTGSFKCIYENQTTYSNGVTNLKLAGDRLIVARLNGRLDFLRLETYTQGRQIDWSFTSAYRRTHIRTGSAGSLNSALQPTSSTTQSNGHLTEELRCILECQLQGHQQPITCLEVVGNTVLTGSQDHTLKVFRLETTSLLYTLHGHYGPITSVFIDSYQSGTGGSGSQDGLLCVWDLITGACMYKIQAHYDAIVSLVCTPSYVISLGLDERLRVWERFQGHLLNTINVMHAYSGVLMLTPSLLVTGKPGSLVVWDVHTGEPAREVKLDCANQRLCPKFMLSACGSVICDFGNQMRIVRFPLVAADKCE